MVPQTQIDTIGDKNSPQKLLIHLNLGSSEQNIEKVKQLLDRKEMVKAKILGVVVDCGSESKI